MKQFRDIRWIVSEATRPFLTNGEGKPLPKLDPIPIFIDHPSETIDERFDRLVAEHVPLGSRMIGGTRVYSMDGDGPGWLFVRDPRELE